MPIYRIKLPKLTIVILTMKKLAWLPNALRNPLYALKNNYHQHMQRRELKRALRDHPVKKIILGAANTHFPNWVSTNYPIVDITHHESMSRHFKAGVVSAFLAEHVRRNRRMPPAETVMKRWLRGGICA